MNVFQVLLQLLGLETLISLEESYPRDAVHRPSGRWHARGRAWPAPSMGRSHVTLVGGGHGAVQEVASERSGQLYK